MNQEHKDMIMKELDQILDQVPTDKTKCDMNQYVDDYIYKSSLLKRNLERRLCDSCRENNMLNCENCDIHIKKEELDKSIKFSSKISKKNKRKAILKKISVFCGKTLFRTIIVLVALFGITFDTTVKKIFYDYMPITPIILREQELKCLRIDFSREYIENELGKPKNIYEIKVYDKSYFRTAYIDKYYTLLCYYNDIGSLLGYMIISNRSDFHFQCYRSDIKLLENSVSEARNILEEEGIVSQPILKDNFDGERLDNSRYYYECKMQHSFGALETCYVGFGFTDIGYITDKIEPNIDSENHEINFITVFSEYNFSSSDEKESCIMIDFINDYVINDGFAGLSKDNLTNLSEDVDFNDRINEYLDEYKE